MRESIKITNRDEWLQHRSKDITSTEISALYDLNPYIDKYSLFEAKRSQKIIEIETNERMHWGVALEESIAREAARRFGLEIEKFDTYIRDPEARIGSSFDYKINVSGELNRQGRGILEIKNIDSFVFNNKWKLDDHGSIIEAPMHIELQIQHQLEVADEYEYTLLFGLVGGNTGVCMIRDRDMVIGQDIRNKAKNFWSCVDNNIEPDIDLEKAIFTSKTTKDLQYIKKSLDKKIFNKDDQEILEANKEIDDLILRYKNIKKEIEGLQFVEESIKLKIKKAAYAYKKIISQHGTILFKTIPGSEGIEITKEMVGKKINQRKSFREFRFYDK